MPIPIRIYISTNGAKKSLTTSQEEETLHFIRSKRLQNSIEKISQKQMRPQTTSNKDERGVIVGPLQIANPAQSCYFLHIMLPQYTLASSLRYYSTRLSLR